MADRTIAARRARPGDDAIGQFYIDQEIGKGSFAQVYSGRHKVRILPIPKFLLYRVVANTRGPHRPQVLLSPSSLSSSGA